MPETRSALQPIFLAGPTASGKSSIALELARRMQGEIISVDSMQVYRGMDIGTAKPTASERAAIPHHVIDVVSLDEGFDAARFVRMATDAVAEIQGRGKVPYFCGGTGLYFTGYLHGLGRGPAPSPELRSRLETLTLEQLVGDLVGMDREAPLRVDLQNRRRVIRALEVLTLTGQPLAAQRSDWSGRIVHGLPFAALRRSRDDLAQRIERRVEAMFAAGLVEETLQLLTTGLRENPTAAQALGYRQVMEHLAGERSLADTIELVKIRTRQFAKRQMTWLRGQLAPEWFDLPVGQPDGECISRLEVFFRERQATTSLPPPPC